MKRFVSLFLTILYFLALCGCADPAQQVDIAATTLPVYEFTARLCQGTDLTVRRLVTESVSCLHDYSLSVDQAKTAEAAELTVISGAGLEDFLADLTVGSRIIDASRDIELICGGEEEHHDHGDGDHHHHAEDPHFWLSPAHASRMAENICDGLCQYYPVHADTFRENLAGLLADLEALREYGEETLGSLSCRELITFHDGFAYFAQAFGLTILEAVEEESGSEASAKELIHMIGLVEEHRLSAVFTECNGSPSAPSVIARETGAAVFALDMAMAGDSYFTAMYHNIDTVKEALK